MPSTRATQRQVLFELCKLGSITRACGTRSGAWNPQTGSWKSGIWRDPSLCGSCEALRSAAENEQKSRALRGLPEYGGDTDSDGGDEFLSWRDHDGC